MLKNTLVAIILFSSVYSFGSIRCEDLFSVPAQQGPAYSSNDLEETIKTSGRSAINQLRKMGRKIVQDTFVTARRYYEYVIVFDKAITDVFNKLTEDDVVLDAGCGDAHLSKLFFKHVKEYEGFGPKLPSSRGDQIEEEYSNRPESQKPTYVGVTYSLNELTENSFANRKKSNKFKLLTGRFFEDIPDHELHNGKKVKVITDFFGVLTYAERIDLVMQKYLRLLDKGGSIFIAQPHKFKLGDELKFYAWLESIEGIKVRNYNIAGNSGVVITITSNVIKIPELKFLGSEPTDPPPIRHYSKTGNYLIVDKDE